MELIASESSALLLLSLPSVSRCGYLFSDAWQVHATRINPDMIIALVASELARVPDLAEAGRSSHAGVERLHVLEAHLFGLPCVGEDGITRDIGVEEVFQHRVIRINGLEQTHTVRSAWAYEGLPKTCGYGKTKSFDMTSIERFMRGVMFTLVSELEACLSFALPQVCFAEHETTPKEGPGNSDRKCVTYYTLLQPDL